GALFHAHEGPGVAEFASIPHRVFGMGKDDVRHYRNLRVEHEIVLHDERVSFYGDALQRSRWLDESQLLRFFPIQSIPEALFGKRLTELEKVVIGRDLQPVGVASLASLRVFRSRLLRAGLEDCCSIRGHLPVMTGAT